MTLPAAEIERIVQEVVRRLRAASGAPAENGSAESGPVSTTGPSRAAAPASAASAIRNASTAGRLVMSQRLITTESLWNRLDGVRQLVIPPRALITPLVRDELKQRGIELVRATGDEQAERLGPAVILAICGSDDGGLPELVVQSGGEVERLLRGKPGDVIRMLAAALHGGARAVLVSCQAAAAVCLANRYRTLRAVWGVSPEAVRQAVDAVAPNLLVLQPTDDDRTETLKCFLEAGLSPCPAAWSSCLKTTGEQVTLGKG